MCITRPNGTKLDPVEEFLLALLDQLDSSGCGRYLSICMTGPSCTVLGQNSVEPNLT